MTNCDRPLRLNRSHNNAVPVTPNSVCRRWSSVSWLTVSKAADRSRPTRTVTCLSSAAAYTLSKNSSSAVSVECCFLYADWNWSKFLELSRWGDDVPTQASPAPMRWSPGSISACNFLELMCPVRLFSAMAEQNVLACSVLEIRHSVVTSSRSFASRCKHVGTCLQ